MNIVLVVSLPAMNTEITKLLSLTKLISYLAENVRSNERCFVSLLKLADTTKVDSDSPEYKSTYDILCGDLKQRLSETTEDKEIAHLQLTVFSHYHSAFRIESRKRPNMHLILRKALVTAGMYYTSPYRQPRRIYAM